jgi:hypothetical protein
LVVTAAAFVLTATTGVWTPLQAHAHLLSTSGCSVRWGSLPEAGASWTTAQITDVRVGRHTCYDRLVIDVAGSVAGAYAVRYVPVGTFDGSSSPPLQGGAVLEVITRAAVSPADSFLVDSVSLVDVNVDGYRTFRQIRWAGSFEGETTIALGVRARLPFRVFVLPGPGSASRLVVDVAHRW